MHMAGLFLKHPFYGLEKDVLVKALRSLELQRRAQLMNIGTESEGLPHCQKSSCEYFLELWLLSLLNLTNRTAWTALPLPLEIQ
ncbi:hypothetical protein ANCDUO_24812, partial [Ancylostoma duodenale]